VIEQRLFNASEISLLVRGNLIAWGVVAVLFCVIPSALIFLAVPKFDSLFSGFGADLPDGTMFLLRWRLLLLVLPTLAVLLLGLALNTAPDNPIKWHQRIVMAFAALCCSALIVEGLAVVALYAPIFRLGAVV